MTKLTIKGQFLPSQEGNAELPFFNCDFHTLDATTWAPSALPMVRNVPMLIDTGAAASVIDPGKVHLKGVAPISASVPVLGVGTEGSLISAKYPLQIRIGGAPCLAARGEFYSLDLGNRPWAGLIGMDILRKGRLTIDLAHQTVVFEIG